MRAYSMDLRERVAAAVDHEEGSLRQIARTFRVSLSFIARLLRRRRRTGSLVPKPHGGGHPPALDREHLKRLRRLVRKRPDATLEELRQRLGVPCSRMAIWRALRGRKITRKKKVLHAQQRDAPAVRKKRKAFREEVAVLDPRRLVFVDATGATTAMTRAYGRAPRGQRVAGAVPGRWKSVTLISALRLSGVMAPLAFEGATDTAAFQTYGEQALVPQLRPGDVVVWDNLKPHKNTQVVPSGRAGRGASRAAAAVQLRPDADREDVLEGQGVVEVGGRPHDRGGLRREGGRVAGGLSRGHPGMVPIVWLVRQARAGATGRSGSQDRAAPAL